MVVVFDMWKKNVLVKESEYGVVGVKVLLLDVLVKVEDVWGLVLGGWEKEEYLCIVLNYMNKFKDYMEFSMLIVDSIKRKDYEILVEEYNRVRVFVDDVWRLL